MSDRMPRPSKTLIRCDEWCLASDGMTLRMATDSVVRYRKLTNALIIVFASRWPQVSGLPVQDLESLFHDTAKTKTPNGAWFRKHFHKVPSYLRRAATMAAYGHVSSFVTRYRSWQGGDRRLRQQRPPVIGKFGGWPVLYAANGGAGAMMHRHDDAVEMKLFDRLSGDWIWRRAAVTRRGKRAGSSACLLSPTLRVHGGSLSLAQPYETSRRKRDRDVPDRVCSVDQGVNRQAVCSIIDPDGTVLARKFISSGMHINQRDKVLVQIREKARQTMGSGGKLTKGFCRTLYERAKGLNLQIARDVSRAIMSFAVAHGASVIVFEDMKHFRPKGGRKRSNMRQRFHGWLHRLLVKQAMASAEEKGLRVDLVFPRGTSAWAYDGSGRVVRDRENYGRCRFKTGKQYDCDLSASYNIAARWFARRGLLPAQQAMDVDRREAGRRGSPAGGKTGWPARGRRSGADCASTAGPRMPVTLSALWVHSKQRLAA